MTRVEFHYNIGDKPRYLQRLLHKVLERDLSALVLCPAEQLVIVDQRLWTDEPASFLPHCNAQASETTRSASPVWLSDTWVEGHGRQVLINFGLPLPQGPGPVQRWLELISTDPADTQAGRRRWRDYQARGLSIEAHDRSGREA